MALRSSRLAPFAAFDTAGRAGRQVTDQLLQSPWLAGPTGETNKLILEPRGLLLCVLDETASPAYWMAITTAALTAGNVTLLAAVPGQARLAYAVIESWQRAKVPDYVAAVIEMEEERALDPLISNLEIASVCIAPESPLRGLVTRLAASRQGALIPVIADPWTTALMHHLIHEKTITENTAALGGNVNLLRLE